MTVSFDFNFKTNFCLLLFLWIIHLSSYMENNFGNLARDVLLTGAPPSGVYFVPPDPPLVIPQSAGGLFICRLNTWVG